MKINYKTTITLTEEENKAINTILHILYDDIDFTNLKGRLALKNGSYDYVCLSLINRFLTDLLDTDQLENSEEIDR